MLAMARLSLVIIEFISVFDSSHYYQIDSLVGIKDKIQSPSYGKYRDKNYER